MSTTYRILVHCDEQRSGACHGLLEVSREQLFGEERVLPVTQERGWLRGYGASQTYDVCPACRALDTLAGLSPEPQEVPRA
jgi:hypothetical protein